MSGSRRSEFLTNEDSVAKVFNPPTGNRIKCGRAERLTCTQTETCMVPGTTHCFIHYESFMERSVIVGAVSSDREEFCATPNQQNILAIHYTQQRPTLLQFLNENSVFQICSFSIAHISPHTMCSHSTRAGLPRAQICPNEEWPSSEIGV